MMDWEPLSINELVNYVSLYERTISLLELKHNKNGIIWEHPPVNSENRIHIEDDNIYYELELLLNYNIINKNIEFIPVLKIDVKYKDDIKPMDKICGELLALKLYNQFLEIYSTIADCLKCNMRLDFEFRVIDQGLFKK